MTGRTKRTAGDVLLELLQKVPDAGALEVLLEPEHLLALLRARGHRDDVLRDQLARGEKLPGELLLDVLAAQPDHRALLAELGNPSPRPRAVGTQGAGPSATAPTAGPIAKLLFGALLGLPSSWYLFVRLDVLRVPGLMLHFPGAYALLTALVITGFGLVAVGVRDLARAAR